MLEKEGDMCLIQVLHERVNDIFKKKCRTHGFNDKIIRQNGISPYDVPYIFKTKRHETNGFNKSYIRQTGIKCMALITL